MKIMLSRTFRTLAGAGLLSLALTACASGGDPTNTPEPTPAPSVQTSDPAPSGEVELVIKDINDPQEFSEEGSPYQAWVVDGNIIYSAAGSSSCPPTVHSAIYDDSGTVALATLSVRNYSDQMCTMDYVRYSQEISLPSGDDIPEDVEIKVETISNV